MHHPDVEVDLEKIEMLGQVRKDENYRFRTYLKGKNARKVDLLVHQLNEEISAKVDCTTCGNCCKHLSPCLTKDDLKHLTEGLHLNTHKTIERYTETNDGELSLKFPCPLLKDNKCTIYENRPETCASFPHLHKDHFVSRARQVMDSYSICPIIFNVIERLKQELHFE